MASQDRPGRRGARPKRRNAPSDGQMFRRALGIGLVGVFVALAGLSIDKAKVSRIAAVLPVVAAKTVEPKAEEPKPLLWPAPLSEALRKKGYHECLPPDPIGLGPYQPYKNLSMGRIAIPQRGGHTPDMGYDVVIHFHGYSPVRKTLVQVARGVTYVGIDRGIGSGVYSNAMKNPETWRTLLRSIEGALKKESNDDRAHIRHLAISAWSAGYGAVNEILKYDPDKVDAVILLDGLHAGWNPRVPTHKQNADSALPGPIEPTFRFAKRALAGEKIFIFTHSHVDPEKYPSTEVTADLMLRDFGLSRTPIDPKGDRFGQVGTVDVKGFHLWSFQGTNEYAHCTHISYMAQALHVIEAAWDTPELDRSVENTPAPTLGNGKSDEGDEIELTPVAGDAGTAEVEAPLDMQESATAALTTAGLPKPIDPAPPATRAPVVTPSPAPPPAPPAERPVGGSE